MRRRTVVAALVGVAAFAAAAVGMPATPAGAQEGSSAALVGNFVGGPEDEMFLYDSLGEDALVTLTNNGTPGGDVFLETHPFRVTGTYSPVAGDFDGDGYDEIFWYAPGTARDSVWNFNSTSSVTSSSPYTVNGSGYRPQAGNFLGDGTDDILWYGPGSVADSVWDFETGGTYRSVPQQIGGTYRPVVGSYGTDGTDDVFWWGPGSAADSLWDFRPDGTRTSTPYTVNGSSYSPFALDIYNQGFGGGDLFWYAPGAGRDTLWDFLGGVRRESAQSVSGDYLPVAGNFLGDGCDDVMWFGYDTLRMWDYSCTPTGGATRYSYDFFAPAAAAAAPRSGAAEPAPSVGLIESVPHQASAVPG